MARVCNILDRESQSCDRVRTCLPEYRLKASSGPPQFESPKVVATDPSLIMEDISKPRRGSSTCAWVNIIYGCNEHCTYCVVPGVRGVEQSRPKESIRQEMLGLAAAGYREVGGWELKEGGKCWGGGILRKIEYLSKRARLRAAFSRASGTRDQRLQASRRSAAHPFVTRKMYLNGTRIHKPIHDLSFSIKSMIDQSPSRTSTQYGTIRAHPANQGVTRQNAAKTSGPQVTLLGQNVDAYGRDMVPKQTFADLLRYVADVPGIERVRFVTSHPRYMSPRVVETVAEMPTMTECFMVPFQSGDDEVRAKHDLPLIGHLAVLMVAVDCFGT